MEIQTHNRLTKFEVVTNKRTVDAIINILYDNLTIGLYGYKMFEPGNCTECLDIAIRDNYLVTPHIMGINCWMIFVEIDNVKHQVFINKRDLKHLKKQIDYNTLKIYTFKFAASQTDKLFPLTVFSGKFIHHDGNLVYNIMDVYFSKGISYLQMKLPEKMAKLNEKDTANGTTLLEYINNNLLQPVNQSMTIKMSSLYDMRQLGDLVFNKIKQSKLKINGLIFMPQLSGKIFIYINDDEFTALKTSNGQESYTKEYVHLSIPAIPLQFRNELQLDGQFENTFVLRKTKIADVFEIYNHLYQAPRLYMNIYDGNKVGIAHIPNINTSYYCKKKGDQLELFVNKCIYNVQFKKWQPIIE
jgi:hypothetical protein